MGKTEAESEALENSKQKETGQVIVPVFFMATNSKVGKRGLFCTLVK